MTLDVNDKCDLLKRIHLFRGIEDAKLQAAAAYLDEVILGPDTTIFDFGDDPEHFFIIYSGLVKIYRLMPDGPKEMGSLEAGDYFGLEVLETNWPRQIRAVTETEVTLLRLSVPDFVSVLELIPSLAQRLQLILDSYRLILRTHFDWLVPNELIYYLARKHVLFMWLRILMPLVFGAIVIPIMVYVFLHMATILGGALLAGSIVITGVWLAWSYIDWTNDYYIVTNRRIAFQEKVVLMYDSRDESPMEQLQSSSINTSQIGRIVGYGNVVVRTFYGTILFRNIANPEQVMSIIQDRQFHTQTYQRWAELREINKRLNERLEKGPKMPPPPLTGRPQQRPDPLRDFISSILHIRYEVAGTVIYRTHWFVLIKKVAVPLLIILGMLAFYFLNLLNRFPVIPGNATCSLTLLVILVVLPWLIYQYMDWHNDRYLITPEQVVDVNKKPLGHEERRAAPLNRIQTINYERLGIIGLLLNFGTVYIQVGDQKLTFDEVWKPADVQRELFHRLTIRTAKDKELQAETERQRMEDWIATYHEISARHEASRGKPPPQPPLRGGF